MVDVFGIQMGVFLNLSCEFVMDEEDATRRIVESSTFFKQELRTKYQNSITHISFISPHSVRNALFESKLTRPLLLAESWITNVKVLNHEEGMGQEISFSIVSGRLWKLNESEKEKKQLATWSW